jgi:uncharacterized protein
VTLPAHQISGAAFAALASGGGGTAVHSLVAAQYSKRVLLVWGVMNRAQMAGHPQAKLARRGYELLSDIQHRSPAAVDAVLRHPPVGAWAERTLRVLLDSRPANRTGRPGGGPAQLASLAAAAAVRAGEACAIEVPVDRGVVTLPSLGQVVPDAGFAPGGLADLRCTSEGTRVIAGRHLIRIPPDTSRDGPGWRGLRPLHATAGGMTVRLLLDDLDPYRMPAARALSGRLGAAEVARWQAALREAWELLVRYPATTAQEIQAAVRVLTPLRSPGRGQVSASSPEVFGCVALSPPADGRALAVTLAHEVQHAKLAALLDLVTLTLPDDGRRYYAPWRDDPRPIAGLLQGAYAYLGVSGFWRWQREQEHGRAAIQAHAEFARWRDAATLATGSLLASGRLTEQGTAFVSGMRGTLRAWAADEVPGPAQHLARDDSERHLAAWRRRHGGIGTSPPAGQ